MIKIAIVEDNNALRQSLTSLLNQTEGMQCVASLGNLLNVVSELGKSKPNIVLMDIGLPHISGIEGVRTVKENFNTIEVLMFTVFEDDDKIFEALKAGATGYLLKKSSSEEIIEAIRSLYYGGSPMSANIARKVIHSFQTNHTTPEQDFQLTTREKELLHSLVDGLSYKKIADKYFISISTVRSHIRHIYEKLHVNSKAQAVAKVLKK
ncbi:MAG TPA: response regulator transcription factor [Hanamia sp.]|jgi:DNA-binding NarL/FixJ family response regulator|nr:response regulator transcription factor [Hanamia sp.]